MGAIVHMATKTPRAIYQVLISSRLSHLLLMAFLQMVMCEEVVTLLDMIAALDTIPEVTRRAILVGSTDMARQHSHIKAQLEVTSKSFSNRRLIEYLMVITSTSLAILRHSIQLQAVPIRSMLQDLNKATMVILDTIPGSLIREVVHTITQVLMEVHQVLSSSTMALDMPHTTLVTTPKVTSRTIMVGRMDTVLQDSHIKT